jgi:hypothetical protein
LTLPHQVVKVRQSKTQKEEEEEIKKYFSLLVFSFSLGSHHQP